MQLLLSKFPTIIKWLIPFIILLAAVSTYAQTKYQQHFLDSLNQFPGEDTQRVNWLNKLAHSYWNTNPQKTDSLGRKALELSQKLNYPKGVCSSYYEMAVGQWMLGNYPLAHENASHQLKVAEEHGLNEEIVDAYSILALIYDDQGLVNEALKYHWLVLENRKSNADSLGIATSLNNIASVYFQMDSLDKSLALFRQSYAIRKALGAKRGMRESLSNIAYVLNQQQKPEEAMPLIKESLEIAQELNDLNGIVNLGSSLGRVYLNLNEIDSAERILLKTLPLAKKMGVNKRIIEIKGNLVRVYEQKKNFRKAYEFQKEYWALKDSIEGQEATNRILELQARYENEKKEKEISVLQQQNQKSRSWRNVFALGALTMVFIAAFITVYYRYRQLKSKKLIDEKELQTKQLQELSQMKSRFLANISHEFRTPLTLIIGPTQELISSVKEANIKQQLSWIYTNSQKLLKLINQLLELSKLEAGQQKLKASQQDIVSFGKHFMSVFESLASQKNVKLKFKSTSEQIFIYFDPEKLEQVINNLLSNAFKFTNEGVISMRISEQSGSVSVEISDSGSGIHEHQLPYIFDRFYQAEQDETKAYQGTGIGLALCKELVELHSGNIEVKSELGKGTSFKINLPAGREHLSDEEVLTVVDYNFADEFNEENFQGVDESPTTVDQNLPLVLIVDDNKDIIKFIQSLLKGKYRTLEAYDGNKGLGIARDEVPDLIISDVMMPGISGLELCRKIKTDIKTDHIPIILLTARVGEDQKIEGLEAKADDYLQKPFNRKELEVKIHNLIENKKRLQRRFADKVVFQPSEIAESAREETFLKNIVNAVERHFKDSEFDVMMLCESVGMSKSQLNRKMKAVFDKSPNQFIRSYRLEKAKQLIQSNKELTLSEIAYDVGFASPAYFSKCFHDEFGYSPSDIKN